MTTRLLVLVAALLLALLAAPGVRWAVDNYRDAPTPARVFDDPRLSFRPAAHLARTAVRAFRDLPAGERTTLHAALARSVTPLARWHTTRARHARLVCLGERHDPATRDFLGAHVLPLLDLDVLMLEAGAGDLDRLLAARARGEPVSLLGAPLDPLLVAATDGATLAAIDDAGPGTALDRGDAASPGLAGREVRLVRNLARHWRADARNVIVFGALHCRDLPGWMFHEVGRQHPRIAEAGMHGAVVLARYQEAGAQILFYLLEEIGLGASAFAVADVSRFPHLVQAWLPPTADALAGYDAALFFDERALGLAPTP